MRRRVVSLFLLLLAGMAPATAAPQAQDPAAAQREAQRLVEEAMRQMREMTGQVQEEAADESPDDSQPVPEGLVADEKGVLRLRSDLVEVLRRGGWPPSLGELPPPADTLLRTDQDPLAGDLQLLGAFALIAPTAIGDAERTSDHPLRVPRNEIAGVLPNGRGFPDRLPLLDPEADGIVDDQGSLHSGSVQIAHPSVTVGARTLDEAHVALVHLGVTGDSQDFRQGNEAPADEPPGSGGSAEGDPPPPGAPAPDFGPPGSAGPRASVPETGCWIGHILYTVHTRWEHTADNRYDVRYKLWLTERPMHGESAYATSGGAVTPVALDILAMRYTVKKDRMVIDSGDASLTWDPWTVQGMVWGDQMDEDTRRSGEIQYTQLADLDRRMRSLYPDMAEEQLQGLIDGVRAGYGQTQNSYRLMPKVARAYPGWEAPMVRVVTRAPYGTTTDTYPFQASDLPIQIGWGAAILTGDTETRFLDEERRVMAGRYRRTSRLAAGIPHEYSAYWRLTKHDIQGCRILLPDLPPDDSRPCDHLRAKLARAEAWAEDDGAELDWIADQLAAMAPEFERLGASMAALKPYFELALGLSAVSDMSQEFLKMAVASHRLQAAAQAGQITRGMAARITAVMKLMGILSDAGGWTFSETVEDQTKQVVAERFADEALGNPAELIGLYQRLQVVAAYTRGDDLDLVLDYVDNNLGMWVGSDYVIRKARGYVEQAKKFNDLWADASQLTGRAVRLDYQISSAQIEAEHWRRKLEECEEELESGSDAGS